MSFTFSLRSQTDSNSDANKSPAIFSDDDHEPPATAKTTYITEFSPSDAPKPPSPKPIAPLPDRWAPSMNRRSLTSLPLQSNPFESSLQFESLNIETDDSIAYGSYLSGRGEKEKLADFELRKLKEELDNLPDDLGLNDFEDVPVEGFGLALLSGYGWKEGRGIGRNSKGDVKVHEIKKKFGRGGLGFSGEAVKMENNRIDA